MHRCGHNVLLPTDRFELCPLRDHPVLQVAPQRNGQAPGQCLRLKGWMLMRQGRVEEAEAQLRESIDCARHQQARSWELRTSTTLAELLVERGEREAARELHIPIYNWFTEGFHTHDLKHAKALLEKLS